MKGEWKGWFSESRRFFLKTALLIVIAVLCAILPAGGSWAAVPILATGYDHTVVVLSDGTLWTWGANSYGQIGDGTTGDRLTPLRTGIGSEWANIAAGKFYTVALKSDRSLWAWGSNRYGQLGDGTIVDRHLPVQIGMDSDWVSIEAGIVHTMALKSNGTLWAWGRNQAGQLGDGTKIDRTAPVQVGTDSDWAAVAAGTSHTMALKIDRTLWAWGSNIEGQLGDGTTVQHSTPVQIGTDSDWAAIEGGDKYTLAIKSDGSLWAWGSNLYGQLGDGTTVRSLVPVRIGTDFNWSSVSGNADHSVAVKADGTLWAWGRNISGQLGNGTVVDSYLPVETGSGVEWTAIATGDDHTLALASDSAVWAWGGNAYGQLGDGTTTGRLLPGPIQVQTVTPAAAMNGSMSPSTPQSVNWGTTASFTLIPDVGCRTDSVSGCDGTLSGNIFMSGPITADCTVQPAFANITYTITASTAANGSITPAAVEVAYGTSQSFTISPSTGYGIGAVQIDGVSIGPVSSYTFVNVRADHTISALFIPQGNYVINAAAGPNGTINPSGRVAVPSGTNKSFTITANSGYRSNVVVDGVNKGSISSYAFTNVTAYHTISAEFSPTITSSASANGTISPSGIAIVPSGTGKTYTITPTLGYHVADVLVDGVSAGAVTAYTFTSVTTPHTISVTFAANPAMTITATAGPNGSINPSGAVSVLSETNKSFTITPASGYRVSDVVVDGASRGAITSYTFTNVTANHTISAAFSPTITATSGTGGTISPSGIAIVPSGTGKTYTITPTLGYHVADVLVDGVSAGAVTAYTFTNVTAPHTISVTFAANPAMTITATAGPNGSINPSGAVSVLSETNKSFTITPASGYRVSDVVVDGVNKGSISSYTFTNVTANHTISVAFSPTITATSGTGGTISPSGIAIVPSGTGKTYTITPTLGYHVADVLVDGLTTGLGVTEPPLSHPVTHTFTNVTTPHTISVTFAANPAMTITATAGPNGSINPSGAVSVLSETNKSFTITPASGYRVSDVVVDGASRGSITSYTFTNVTANHTISAAFSPTITSSAGPHGTISPSGIAIVPSGTGKTHTITPTLGYHVADVLVDGLTTGLGVTEPPLSHPVTHTFTNVTAPHTISAAFAANPTMTITATAGPNGSINPSGAVSVLSETNKSFTITPASGYRVSDVVVDGASRGAITSYTFTNVTANHTISVAFSPTITATSGTGGTISPSGITVVPSGTGKTYTITPTLGYHVADVLVDGLTTGLGVTEPPLSHPVTHTFTNVTAPHTISVTFAANPTMTITATAGPNGSINPSGAVSVLSETNKSFTITPASGYRVSDVVVDGVNKGSISSYTFTNVTANHTISVAFSPTITASSGTGGTISPSGIAIVPSGTGKIYTITPTLGYHVADVLVDGLTTGLGVTEPPLSHPVTHTFTNVTTPHTISVTFAANPAMTITATAGPNGSINPSGAVSVLSETNKSFTITPASGYRVSDVVVDGVNKGSISSYTFTNVTANHTISVAFSPTITASSGTGGTISPSGIAIVPSGTGKIYTITPTLGYHVADVLVDGLTTGLGVTEPPLSHPVTYTFTNVTTPHTISVTFAANPTMTITATAGPNGSINPSGAVSVLSETNKSFTITPASGYRVSDVVVDGVNKGSISSYTFTNVTANHTISAAFSPTITASSGTGGTISPSGIAVVPSGTGKTYTITPSAGYHVADVVVDGVSAGAVTTYTFISVTMPHTISATFSVNQ